MQKGWLLKDRIGKTKHSMVLLLIIPVGISIPAHYPDLQMAERLNGESDKETKKPSAKSRMQGLGLHNNISSIDRYIPQGTFIFKKQRMQCGRSKGRIKDNRKRLNCLKSKETVKGASLKSFPSQGFTNAASIFPGDIT